MKHRRTNGKTLLALGGIPILFSIPFFILAANMGPAGIAIAFFPILLLLFGVVVSIISVSYYISSIATNIDLDNVASKEQLDINKEIFMADNPSSFVQTIDSTKEPMDIESLKKKLIAVNTMFMTIFVILPPLAVWAYNNTIGFTGQIGVGTFVIFMIIIPIYSSTSKLNILVYNKINNRNLNPAYIQVLSVALAISLVICSYIISSQLLS